MLRNIISRAASVRFFQSKSGQAVTVVQEKAIDFDKEIAKAILPVKLFFEDDKISQEDKNALSDHLLALIYEHTPEALNSAESHDSEKDFDSSVAAG